MKHRQVDKFLDYWEKFTSGSTNRKIFSAAVTVGFLTAFVKLAALVKELVVASRFGIGDELDAFLIAFMVPGFIVTVVAGSFNAALIPTYIKVREQQGIKAAQKLFSGVTIWSVFILTVATIIMVITTPLYFPLIASGFEKEKLNLTFNLLCLLAPFVILAGIITIWGAVLNSGERFALAAISPVLSPAVTILLLISFKHWGVFTLAAGLVCGELLEIVILGAALKRQGILLLPKWYGFDAHLRQVLSQYAPTIMGAFLMCSAGLVDQAMAAKMPSGSVAALNYGYRVISVPLVLTSTALSTAVMPYFSKMIASQDWVGLRNTLRRYLILIFSASLPLVAIFLFFSENIVRLLFYRGQFTLEDVHIVTLIQNCFVCQIPFYVAGIFLVRLISAIQLNYILTWVSGCNLLVNIVFNYILMRWMGVAGIALSTTFVYIISLILLTLFFERAKKELPSDIKF